MGTSGGMASTDHTGSCVVKVIDECRSERLHSAEEWRGRVSEAAAINRRLGLVVGRCE